MLSLPDARYVITEGLGGISTLQAIRINPETGDDIGDFQFKLMVSPKGMFMRLELYDPNILAILFEQIVEAGYSIISSGEDVEFTHGSKGGWLGWAHLMK